MTKSTISLRGVAVNNLQKIDLDLPHRKLIAFCGVSGSGKTSLALDTLYAEGQRRYIESFSTYTRQFLEQLDKPTAESIEGIPPSIAVTRKNVGRSSRATVGRATQINEHLQLLLARIGEVVCHGCGQKVSQDSAESAAERLGQLPDGTRLMIGFTSQRGGDRPVEVWIADLIALGYRRVIVGDRFAELSPTVVDELVGQDEVAVVLDRVVSNNEATTRLRDSLEAAQEAGCGSSLVWIDPKGIGTQSQLKGDQVEIDGQSWFRCRFSQFFRCEACHVDYPALEPQLLNYNNPLGACPACEGFGNVIGIDMDRVVPDNGKSLREGAIAPWNTPAYEHELQELLALAKQYDLPVDVPFKELTPEHLTIIHNGVPECKFGGLTGFFNWLERRKYKMHLRVYLSRWRSYYPCKACGGARLNPSALAVRIGGKNVAEIYHMKIRDALTWLAALELSNWQQQVGRLLLEQVINRLKYLDRVGVGHLSLERALRTLSAGEAQRVSLTSALGSNLVGMLYVLDEPCIGLHPADVPQLVDAIEGLRDRGNTVAVIEHDASVLRGADHVVEMGPGAGEFGGQVVFQGTPAEMLECTDSRTGDWLSGRRTLGHRGAPRPTENGAIRLEGARGNNLQNLSVEFPLGVMCVVTGVSGSGKSTLVQQTLFPAVAQRLRMDVETPASFDEILGVHQIEDAVLIDQSPIGRTPRSNPITYIKAFDTIRALFADTTEAQAHGFKASHFSFNVDGGRCEACRGDGFLQIDMRLMADVYMKCPECQGRRFRNEVLDVKYRGLNIAEVLSLSVREAFAFFRGHRKILANMKCLMDVGLDYLRLGQPANTLSGGEAQRLKMASYMSAKRRGRTLFVLDEPTTGLHSSDVLQLLDCFDSLIDLGHSLVVVDHNLLIMQAADWIVDLGPGAADDGGRVVAVGTPDQISENPNSITGSFLAAQLAAEEVP
ncbi:excinuclease ABC subunit UvrA [Bythopirellula polymerisocia]|uniref:UvrABC system protein A n=1 Tax=Bythopirellula polymerisocia TaxID=2528003 RepID=A0A5C6CQ72_9BACT|nr:excinuclease ABC subunit UvrA [Bythopirellula polymerisocia]TWU25767.1 UvrABC system protein A [Bythopirellula polymerisocia]